MKVGVNDEIAPATRTAHFHKFKNFKYPLKHTHVRIQSIFKYNTILKYGGYTMYVNT